MKPGMAIFTRRISLSPLSSLSAVRGAERRRRRARRRARRHFQDRARAGLSWQRAPGRRGEAELRVFVTGHHRAPRHSAERRRRRRQRAATAGAML
ncbi:hypothetical protein [Haliangium ochraceum]|uniref:hypothetical protein n=1 Tax=Haliangium ochraceum TaxID=80816 RepID=UPI0018EFA457|nr:hypothetical protein [Haliangium ochraceum]